MTDSQATATWKTRLRPLLTTCILTAVQKANATELHSKTASIIAGRFDGKTEIAPLKGAVIDVVSRQNLFVTLGLISRIGTVSTPSFDETYSLELAVDRLLASVRRDAAPRSRLGGAIARKRMFWSIEETKAIEQLAAQWNSYKHLLTLYNHRTLSADNPDNWLPLLEINLAVVASVDQNPLWANVSQAAVLRERIEWPLLGISYENNKYGGRVQADAIREWRQRDRDIRFSAENIAPQIIEQLCVQMEREAKQRAREWFRHQLIGDAQRLGDCAVACESRIRWRDYVDAKRDDGRYAFRERLLTSCRDKFDAIVGEYVRGWRMAFTSPMDADVERAVQAVVRSYDEASDGNDNTANQLDGMAHHVFESTTDSDSDSSDASDGDEKKMNGAGDGVDGADSVGGAAAAGTRVPENTSGPGATIAASMHWKRVLDRHEPIADVSKRMDACMRDYSALEMHENRIRAEFDLVAELRRVLHASTAIRRPDTESRHKHVIATWVHCLKDLAHRVGGGGDGRDVDTRMEEAAWRAEIDKCADSRRRILAQHTSLYEAYTEQIGAVLSLVLYRHMLETQKGRVTLVRAGIADHALSWSKGRLNDTILQMERVFRRLVRSAHKEDDDYIVKMLSNAAVAETSFVGGTANVIGSAADELIRVLDGGCDVSHPPPVTESKRQPTAGASAGAGAGARAGVMAAAAAAMSAGGMHAPSSRRRRFEDAFDTSSEDSSSFSADDSWRDFETSELRKRRKHVRDDDGFASRSRHDIKLDGPPAAAAAAAITTAPCVLLTKSMCRATRPMYITDYGVVSISECVRALMSDVDVVPVFVRADLVLDSSRVVISQAMPDIVKGFMTQLDQYIAHIQQLDMKFTQLNWTVPHCIANKLVKVVDIEVTKASPLVDTLAWFVDATMCMAWFADFTATAQPPPPPSHSAAEPAAAGISASSSAATSSAAAPELATATALPLSPTLRRF